jgi:hypothetical protein
MAQAETEKLTQILWCAALSRAVCTVAELGIADQIEAGSPQSVESLAAATGTHERSLYRILRFLASHGIFQEKGNESIKKWVRAVWVRVDPEGKNPVFRGLATGSPIRAELAPTFLCSPLWA